VGRSGTHRLRARAERKRRRRSGQIRLQTAHAQDRQGKSLERRLTSAAFSAAMNLASSSKPIRIIISSIIADLLKDQQRGYTSEIHSRDP